MSVPGCHCPDCLQQANVPIPADGTDLYAVATDRLRVLVDFLHRPTFAPTDAPSWGEHQPDVDIVTADNLAREAALMAVRKAAQELIAG